MGVLSQPMHALRLSRLPTEPHQKMFLNPADLAYPSGYNAPPRLDALTFGVEKCLKSIRPRIPCHQRLVLLLVLVFLVSLAPFITVIRTTPRHRVLPSFITVIALVNNTSLTRLCMLSAWCDESRSTKSGS